MNVFRAVTFTIALAAQACAADYTLQLTAENTRIEWTLADPLHTVHGTFKLKHGTVEFNPETGKASGEVVVDVASGDSGGGARDRRMHTNVLESAKYPDATFTPSRVEGTVALPGTSNLKLQGTFNIHGASHPLTMTVQSTVTAEELHATLAFEIPYVEWGMKDPSNFLIKVGKTVQVSIDTSAPVRKH